MALLQIKQFSCRYGEPRMQGRCVVQILHTDTTLSDSSIPAHGEGLRG